MNSVGKPISRIDGPLKTSGTAVYTSDHHFPGLLYGVVVGSTISKGSIARIDARQAEKMPGIHKVAHRENTSPLFRTSPDTDFTAYIDEHRPPFEDDIISYYGQYVALVVADTFEQAQAAARAVKVTYRAEKPDIKADLGLGKTTPADKVVSERGDAAKAFDAATIKVDQTYTTPPETHSAIELHSTIAVWDGDAVTLYETSQALANHRNVLAQQLGIGRDKVRVISKFLGSGFGGKLFPWPHSALAAGVARDIGRPIKLVLDRSTVFQTVGHRPPTQQRVRLSANPDGKLTSIRQEYLSHTAIRDDYEENCGEATPALYSVPNVRVTKGLVHLNVGNATSMRGPGAVPGLFATETAMDELAIALKMDPVQLRIRNETAIDEGAKVPFSSRHLLECYSLGMEKFGWSKRNPAIGSMKQGGLTLGWGMAAGAWMAERMPADATVDVRSDGTARVACGTQDIGTGTYTMLAQIAAERLGIDAEKVEVALGDTNLPSGPLNGGSMATASVVPAVYQAADGAIQRLLVMATTTPGVEFNGKKPEDLALTGGRIHLKDKPATSGIPFAELMQKAHIKVTSGTGRSAGTLGANPETSRRSFCAHFVEVSWEEATARLRINRAVSVIDAGKIINPKTARNQIEGAFIMGIGMALFEETLYDHRSGAPVNGNFADYVMPTNADSPRIDVHFLDYPDKVLNEIGARGVGEIGMAGTAAAIGNAIYHATGIRLRDLPLTVEKLLAARA